MIRIGSILAIASLLIAGSAIASPELMRVAFSGDPADLSPQVDPWTGLREIYLFAVPIGVSFCHTEFSIAGDFEVISLVPAEGVVNLGTASSPSLLADDDSGEGLWLKIATLTVANPDGQMGSLCFAPSELTGRNCSIPCDQDFWRNHLTTCLGVGQEPVWGESSVSECGPVPVEPDTWGRVKSRYR